QQGRSGLGAGLDLVPVGGDEEICSREELAVDRAHPDAGFDRDITHRHFYAGSDEECGGDVEQRPLVPLGVGPFARSCSPCWHVAVDHRIILSPSYLTSGAAFRILNGASLRLPMIPGRSIASTLHQRRR